MGGCYAIGGQAVKLLLAAIQITPYFTFEDVYITGLCASKANVTLRTEPQYDKHGDLFNVKSPTVNLPCTFTL